MNRELYARLGDPQLGQKFIHVAGTNGKGSCCAMLAEILQCSAYKTGLFTSPHLERYNERIRVNGQEISDGDWNRLRSFVVEKAEGLDTVEFDIMTAMAFLYFKEQGCELAVLEAGLGGRLDATNVIEDPMLSVISGIGLEHTEILGNTVAEIAFEKAGIIKPGRPVLVQDQSREALDVFRARAAETASELSVAKPSELLLHSHGFDGQIISYKEHREIRLRLLGSYQYRNAALVLDASDILKKQGLDISEDAIKKALARVVWPGRFELLSKQPLVILDGAHNPHGAEALAECIKDYMPGAKIHFVMGVLADKDYEKMLSLTAPFAKKFTIVSPDSKRALSAERLKKIIDNKYDIPCETAESAKAGLMAALSGPEPDTPVLIFGSLYQVAEIRRSFDLS